MRQALDEVSGEASGIIINGRDAMNSIVNILSGILKKEAGSKYDTLVNLDKIAGKTPEVFIEGIQESIKQLQRALQILRDIDTLASLKHAEI